VLRALFPADFPKSVLDVGCGRGTWLSAARQCGANDIIGIDGVPIDPDELLFPDTQFQVIDLNQRVDLNRQFDLVLCLETAEHLAPESAATLVASLARHGSTILFSAAAPDQPGVGHINCHWPRYWQALFNANGFLCTDSVRWRIWENEQIESWYRQNMILAVRDIAAGTEPRIAPVVHPAVLKMQIATLIGREAEAIADGLLPWHWYVSIPFRAALAKVRRHRR
jgi:SAM-dependent methyltransferase